MRGTGKRALVGVLAGGAWMSWGLSLAHAFSLPVIIVFASIACILLAGCGYCIVKAGRSSSLQPTSRRHKLNLGFLVLTILEAAGVVSAILLARRMNRVDVLADWIGIVVGVHFFGLARVFKIAIYHVTGAAITFWCVLSWIVFHGDTLTISAGLGVGGILWATSSVNLLRVLAKRTSG